MAMGTREQRRRQEGFWLTHDELATAPGHPFYQRLSQLLDQEKFDHFAEGECAQFYAEKNGRPSLTPGMYFRSLLIGTSRGLIRNGALHGEWPIHWRCDSFCRLGWMRARRTIRPSLVHAA
jgi:transposase